MRLISAIILVLLVATAPAVAEEWTHVVDIGGRGVEVRVTQNLGNHSTIRAECVIPAPHDRVWHVLTDYDHLDVVIPVVDESYLESTDSSDRILFQRGRAGLWFFQRGFTVRFRVEEKPKVFIGFEAIDGDFERFVGTWQIDERDEGTWVAHSVEVQPGFFAPGWAVRRVARDLMTATIDGVVAQCMVTGADTTHAGYELREASADGTGKFYMGREISQVMGHRGADWLERESRERDEAPDLLVEKLPLEPDDVVADIGAGTGYFTFRISPLVPDGQVLAVDIQQEMLDIISERMGARRVDNVIPVLGTIDDTRLPADAVDLVLMVDAYHEFSHPQEMLASIVRALRPGGRVVLVEYRAEDPTVPIKPLHKMTEEQARAEMGAAGLSWIETLDFLPRQHVMIFEKR